jgi:hypothetical protein
MSSYSPPPPPPPAPGPYRSLDDIHPTNPPKDPALAVILNVLPTFFGFYGIGYFYIGQWQKGLVGIFGGWMLLVMTVILITFCIGIFLVPVCITMVVLTAVDIHKQTSLLREGRVIGQWTFFSNHK